jgi:exonuclease SbcD
VKFLHTADWHVGKTLKGIDRLEEQRAVLAEIAATAEAHQVDAVLVAGDVYDLSAPSAAAQQLVVRTLLRMRDAGAQVIVIAGNHDHGPTFEAYRPLMGAAGITLAGMYRPAERGGVIQFKARSDGAETRVAMLPFLSQRYAVRAAEIVANTPSENVRAYDEQVRQVITSLTGGFGGDTVNLVLSHITCLGGTFGGGERSAQSIFEYSVPAAIFPVSAHYVALGHLHRRQALAAPAPVHYSGAPLAVDFGEQDNTSVICLVEATPGTPARVTDLPVTAGRRLRTVHGTLEELRARTAELGQDYLRVYLREPTRAGLREDTIELLPHTLEVRIDPEFAPQTTAASRAGEPRTTRTPAQLFGDYCAARDVSDPRVAALFAQLHDEVTATDGAELPAAG